MRRQRRAAVMILATALAGLGAGAAAGQDATGLGDLARIRDGRSAAVTSSHPDPRSNLERSVLPAARRAGLLRRSLRLEPGKHVLRLEPAGRHPLSKGRLIGLDSIRLRERWDKRRPSLKAD